MLEVLSFTVVLEYDTEDLICIIKQGWGQVLEKGLNPNPLNFFKSKSNPNPFFFKRIQIQILFEKGIKILLKNMLE